ncbi:hypothetical protein ACJ41O_010025 [Fusarium nematophilum]
MPTLKRYTVYVVVYKGDPVDLQIYRHTALWFVPLDDDGGGGGGGGSPHYYFEVQGSTGDFKFNTADGVDPTGMAGFAKKVQVADTRHALTPEHLGHLMEGTHVDNHDPEFNCHVWVDRSLNALYQGGYLSKEEYLGGVDGMVDATMEAEDEDYA